MFSVQLFGDGTPEKKKPGDGTRKKRKKNIGCVSFHFFKKEEHWKCFLSEAELRKKSGDGTRKEKARENKNENIGCFRCNSSEAELRKRKNGDGTRKKETQSDKNEKH